MTDRYESPLASRYASDAMLELFSAKTRACTWRKLWVQLAKAEMELGLPITQAQVDELAQHTDTIDFAAAARLERETRHDVMAHIRAYGLDCPSAAGIIHLGATSCYVTDNADLILYRQALCYLRKGLLRVIRNLAQFALRYKDLPTLGYTHLQPAQPVTVGKRACLWLQDLWLDLEELDEVTEAIRFLGCRGTTGTEASFLDLFDGDTAKIDEMNRRIAAAFDFDRLEQRVRREFDGVGLRGPRGCRLVTGGIAQVQGAVDLIPAEQKLDIFRFRQPSPAGVFCVADGGAQTGVLQKGLDIAQAAVAADHEREPLGTQHVKRLVQLGIERGRVMQQIVIFAVQVLQIGIKPCVQRPLRQNGPGQLPYPLPHPGLHLRGGDPTAAGQLLLPHLVPVIRQRADSIPEGSVQVENNGPLHAKACSSAAIFRQIQKTPIACSSSATGGKLGAMRILRSCGSLP